jgi:hypothetical protein
MSLDSKVTQTLSLSGNYVLLSRACFEYPSGMIKDEVDYYTTQAISYLSTVLEELLGSESNLYSIKGKVHKIL